LSPRLSGVEYSVILQSVFAISSALTCGVFRNVPLLHTSRYVIARDSVLPGPHISTEVTNAGVRRPWYEDSPIGICSRLHLKLPGRIVSCYSTSLAWPDPILHRGKGWPHSNLSPRNSISHVNLVMTSVMAIAKVRLAIFLHL